VNGTTATYPAATGPLAVLTSIATGPVASSHLGQTSNSYFWQGDIAEVVIYDHALTGEERHQVEDYLLRKYGSVSGLLPSSPAFSPNGGVFSGSTTVSLSGATPGSAIYYTLDGSDPAPETATLYEGPFDLTATTTVKAKAYVGGLGSVTAVAGFIKEADFNPTSLAGLQVWLRGDAGVPRSGAYVDLWRDQSGNGNDAVQATGYKLPALVTDATSGMPMLRFDGTDDFLSFNTQVTNGRTVFVVLRNGSTSGYRPPLGDTSGYGYLSGASRQIWFTGNQSQILNGETWLNGQTVNGTTATYPAATGPLAVLTSIATGPVASSHLGQTSNSYFWQGDIAEVVIYDHALTTTEATEVATFLAKRYGIVSPFLPW
jgi:hypothetical protein